MTALALELRGLREDDEHERNYVLSSWLLSYAETSRKRRTRDTQGGEFQGLTRDAYFALYEPVVKRLIERSTIAIAWTESLPDSVLGWMAVEGDTLHYVLVKPRWRKLGIASWMLRDLRPMPAMYTHMAPAAERLLGESWSFEPMRRFEKRAA